MAAITVCVMPLPSWAAMDSGQTVSYWLDTHLVYSDHLKRPDTSSDNLPVLNKKDSNSDRTTETTTPTPVSQPERTLGLKDLKIGLRLTAFKESEFECVLRPDAAIERSDDKTTTREYDGRSGSTYKPRPRIQLLDTYAMGAHFSERAEAKVGVFDELLGFNYAYNSPLEFGLQVVFPRKTAAIRLHYEVLDPIPPTAEPLPLVGSLFDIWVFSGNEDRNESIGYQSDSFDRAPVSRDPYLGMAMGFKVLQSGGGEISGFAGYFDTKVQSSRVGEEPGQVNESFVAAGYTNRISLYGKMLKTFLDLRVSRSRWDMPTEALPELTQESISWTNLLQISSKLAAAEGMHMGMSERHTQSGKEKQSGRQLDLGIIHYTVQSLQSHLFMSAENRTSSIDQGGDGFQGLTAANSTSWLMRFSIEFRYMLNKP